MQAQAQTDFWVQTTGFTIKEILSLACDSSGDIYAATAGDGIYRSTNMGLEWNRFNNGLIDTNANSLAINSRGDVFVGTGTAAGIFSSSGGVFRSTNKGASWEYKGCSGRVGGVATNALDQVFVATSWASQYSGAGGLLLRSSDDGSTWPDTLVHDYVTNVSINAAGHIFTVYSLGRHVARSTDNGASFQYLVQVPYGDWVNSIAFGSTNQVYFATDLGIFHSSDNGNAWSAMNNGLSDLHIRAILPNELGILFSASSLGGGTYYSTDNGAAWVENNTGLTNLNVYSMALDSNGNLYCGTSNGDVFRSRAPTTSVRDPSYEHTLTFALAQNYPNPFNLTTNISLTIHTKTYVTLKLFDLVGREISTLLSEELSAGNHISRWDASGLPSGIYFYRLQAGAFSQCRKLLLLK